MGSASWSAAVLAASLLLLGGAVSADIYKYRDYDGHIYLTDKPMKGQYKLLKRYRTPKKKSRRAGG